ncbi:disintegrin and metalloproteinase domain-containing protein 22-like isoform X3 [Ptychodera flava]|uniref:disintegrin and metalloproteinase domain-containing protein 22-like isoform X3 n=1 Tax=Ptychodera flava TaxID=63121 RepID=UPI00396AA122
MLLRKTSVLLICILWGSDSLVVKFSMASPTVGADSERMSSAGCHESKTVIPVRLQKISADQTSATTDLNTAIQGRRTAGAIPMHMERLSLQVDVWNITYILDVKLNTDLISANYTERFFDQSGRLRKRKVTEHCYYHGQVRGRRVSVVAISTCRGLKGMFRIDEQTFSIMPLEPKDGVHPHLLCNWQKLRSKDMVAPEDENILRSKNGVFKLDASNRIRKGIRRDRDFMELMLVNDFSMYQMYGQDLDKVNEYTISAVNILGELYRAQLNTRIVLVATETWTSGNRITVKKDIGETLVNFLDYQYPEVRGQIPRYPAQLITRTSFEEGNSDKTRQDRLCSGIESAGVNTDFGNGSPLFLATTLANHIGLNIGLSNDNRRNCNCSGSIGCINGVISGSYPVVFSSCSVEDHNLFMNNGHGRCVLDVPDDATRRDTHNFAAPICGNGIVESGEECDCGTDEECTGNSCCSTDCMFPPGAVCAHGECCQNCKFKASGEHAGLRLVIVTSVKFALVQMVSVQQTSTNETALAALMKRHTASVEHVKLVTDNAQFSGEKVPVPPRTFAMKGSTSSATAAAIVAKMVIDGSPVHQRMCSVDTSSVMVIQVT